MSFVFHWWWDGLYVPAATWRFAVVYRWITADRAISTILLGASPFQQCCRVEEYCKTALVQLVLQENGYPVQPKLLTIYIPTPVSAKMNDPTAVSANPTKDHSQTTRSRRHERSTPPIMKNVRYTPNNPTETRAIPARTQKAKPNSELGMNSLHLNTVT